MAINDNLIAMYQFNGNANDSSGNAAHGTVTGATLTTDRFGNANSAYIFDGNDLITCTNATGAIGQEFTLSAWVYATSIATGTKRIFISNTDRFGMGLTSGTSFHLYVHDGRYKVLLVPYTSLPGGSILNRWTHCLITFKEGILKFYSDGQFISQLSGIGTIAGGNNLLIGNWSSLAQGFIGTIDDCKVYNRALSDAEIQTLYKIGAGNHSLLSTGEYLTHTVSNLGVDTTGLVGFYNGSGIDYSGNGNSASAPTGNVTYGEDAYGNYIDFNGNKDFTAGTGTLADIFIGNKMNYSYLTDYSWSCTYSVLSVPPNNRSGIFGSDFDNAMQVYTNGVVDIGVRSGATINILTIPGLNWVTDLGLIHTVGFTYIASELKFYVYLDGVLTNPGGTVVTNVFYNNSWRIGDTAILNGNQSSCHKKIYKAMVFSRVLSSTEHLQLANVQQRVVSLKAGKTYAGLIDTHTPPIAPIRASFKQNQLKSNGIITI